MTAAASTSGMSARDAILARVREALRVPAPLPHLKSHDVVESASHVAGAGSGRLPSLEILPIEVARPWLPDGGETPEERLSILTENLAKLRAIVHRVPDTAAAIDLMLVLARERDWKRVAYHASPLVQPLLAGVPCATHAVDSGTFDKDAVESCDAGISACESLVAQTGSILVSSRTCGGRALTILPHVHVVVATVEQVVATLGEAIQGVRDRHGGRMPSMLSFITGPSRTGDIERILVLGAHGPKELIVILVG